MRLKQVTFTGIDERTDYTRLQDIQRRYSYAEFGVLTSYHWYENGNRYLSPQIIDTLRGKNLRMALHVCGSATHDAATGKWEQIDKLTWGNLDLFERVQLNLAGRKNNPEYCRLPLITGQELIVQQRANDELPLYEATLKRWAEMPHYHNDTISVLLDASGGRGIDTPLKILPSSRKVGYAGGFNPDNVADKLTFLLKNVKMGTFWIDMESGVRTNDWFDLDKVEKVLQICDRAINEFTQQ